MNYREVFYFVATCLTISFEDKNRLLIENKLKSGTVNWDFVVKLSTSHYVLPALYINLKANSFLHYLPKDLVTYMDYITGLNKDRNQKIIKQAQELNVILLNNHITPIFLKGTANLLAGLYTNNAERMIGDIDFIFSKTEYSKAIKVLRNNGYKEVGKANYQNPRQKHYRRLKKDNNIAAIEIHKELIFDKYINEFNYEFIKKDCQVINGFTFLSYSNKLNLSIISSQINDFGYYLKLIPLRNAYDVFLISKKTKSDKSLYQFKKLFNPLNCFIASCYEVFNHVDSLNYHNSKKTQSYIDGVINQFDNLKQTQLRNNVFRLFLITKYRVETFIKSLLYKQGRIWLFRKFTDINTYKKK